MHDRGGQGHVTLRIPDGQVGVGADCDRALSIGEAVHACVVSGGKGDKFVERDAAFADTLREQQRQPHLQSGDAVGHVLEGGLVSFWQLSRFVETVRRVIGRKHL